MLVGGISQGILLMKLTSTISNRTAAATREREGAKAMFCYTVAHRVAYLDTSAISRIIFSMFSDRGFIPHSNSLGWLQ